MTFSHIRSWSSISAIVLCLILFLEPASMVKFELFKTCEQSGFCKRNRELADHVAQNSSWVSPYILDPESLQLSNGALSGMIYKTIDFGTGQTVRLPLSISFLESGAARITVDEERRRAGDIELRHGSKARKERYHESAKWALVGGLKRSESATVSSDNEMGTTRILYGEGGKHEAVIQHAPFTVDFKRDGETHVQLNERGLLTMEHWRPKIDKKIESEGTTSAAQEGSPDSQKEEGNAEDESTWWEESFGGNTDSKPRGPEAVGLDITFPGYEHVFGIPEHSGPLSLRQTRGGEGNYDQPYRLWNSDVFEYLEDSPMTLYGAINLMQAQKKGSTVGVFWLNAAETDVDIIKVKSSANPLSLGIGSRTDTKTHWFSESGLLDLFVFLGPSPKDIATTFSELTGAPQLPQYFAIGYHQCRWNYITDADVRDVDRKFDRANIPYDVIWLDLEYTDGKKYFTWDPLTFPDPMGMQKQLDEHQRKLVVIIDPHIKNENDYSVSKELKDKDLAVKNKDNNIYDGWCWPGSSHWVDCFNPKAVEWWKSLFRYDRFPNSASNLFIWNDMNEPSVFNGPEGNMPRDNIFYDGWEHRDLHNINAMTLQNATFQGLLDRDRYDAKGKKKSISAVELKRPFVLTRGFFAGSQRYGAVWTGDSQSSWEALEVSLPMIMSMGISGYPFTGSDVGGFFGNPSIELLTRWYQAGAFYPFMRGHAHIDTRRREPYLASDPHKSYITQAIRLRYSLLPTWYTAFHSATAFGVPIVRPNWWVHPDDERGFDLDDQMYLADTGLLVKPVVHEGHTEVSVYISDAATYYDYFDFTIHAGPAGRSHSIPAPLSKLPLLMQSGHIFPRRDRPRRSSGLMKWDPFTLVVVLDALKPVKAGEVAATGEIYLDDGESYDHTEGAFLWRNFSMTLEADGAYALTSVDIDTEPGKRKSEYLKKMQNVVVEKVIIVGAPDAWKNAKTAKVSEEGARKSGASRDVELLYEKPKGGKAAWAVIRKPDVAIGEGWRIEVKT